MYQQQSIGRSLPIIAKVVAGQMGIEVQFSNRMGASANHGTRVMCLPSLKAIGTEEDAVVLEGLLDHEAAHFRFSDLEYTKLGHQKGVVFNGFRNLIEDIRIERAIGQVFPGSKKNLNRTAGLMRKLGFFTEPEADDHPASKLMALLLYALRYQELGHSFCEDWVEPALAYARQDFGDVADQALECARAASKLGQTPADVHRAVETIMTMLKNASQEEPPPPQDSQQDGEQGEEDDSQDNCDQSASGKGESDENQDEPDQKQDSQSQSGEGDNDNEAKGLGSDSEESDDERDDSNADGSGSKGNDVDSGLDGSGRESVAQEDAGGSGSGQCDPSAAQAVLDALDSDMGNLAKGLEEIIRESGLLEGEYRDVTEVENVSSDLLATDQIVYKRRITEARKATTRIALKLDQLLQAKKDVDRHLAYTGRIDNSRLARTRIGDMRVFHKCDEHEAINTAVYMVLDRSGSMKATIDSVYIAAASMGEVMSRFDVKVAAAMFDDTIDPLGTFDEPWRKLVSRMNFPASGTTLMGAATTFAVGHLAKRPEERKILLYVTDGAPSNFDALEAAVNECRCYGIEATAVLIRPDKTDLGKFEKIMPSGVAMRDEDIPVAVFKALSDLL